MASYIYLCFCIELVNHKTTTKHISMLIRQALCTFPYLTEELSMGMYITLHAHRICFTEPAVSHQVRVSFVSAQGTKEFKPSAAACGQQITKIRPSITDKLALTNASAVLLSFPMAQPAAGLQPPAPTASHITWLKNTGTEGPPTRGYNQSNTE